MTNRIFKSITEWQKETFKNATAKSKLLHLKKEINETIEAIERNDGTHEMEFADCFILLMGAADHAGMDFDDILLSINEKHHINKKREWNKPDKNGIVTHKK